MLTHCSQGTGLHPCCVIYNPITQEGEAGESGGGPGGGLGGGEAGGRREKRAGGGPGGGRRLMEVKGPSDLNPEVAIYKLPAHRQIHGSRAGLFASVQGAT